MRLTTLFILIIIALLITLFIFYVPEKTSFKGHTNCKIVKPYQTKQGKKETVIMAGKVPIVKDEIATLYLFQCDSGQYYF